MKPLKTFSFFLLFVLLGGCIGKPLSDIKPYSDETDASYLSVNEVCKNAARISDLMNAGCIRLVAQYNNDVQGCEAIQENSRFPEAAQFRESCIKTILNGELLFKHGRINSYEGRAYVKNIERPQLVKQCRTGCETEDTQFIENEKDSDIQSAFYIYLAEMDFSNLTKTNTATHIFTCYCFKK